MAAIIMATATIADATPNITSGFLLLLDLGPEATGVFGLADVPDPALDGGVTRGRIGGATGMAACVCLPIPAVTDRSASAKSPAL